MALKVNVAGVWQPVTTVGGGSDEVVISASDPIATYPTTELWYDTDEPAVLTDDVRWNTSWGTLNRVAKVTTEAGYNNSEFGITGFYGMATTAVAGRYTRVSLNLVFSAVTQPSAASYYFIRLRMGSGAAGAILQEFIFPWAVGQQSFGGGSTGYINTHVLSQPLILAAGTTVTWTIQCGSYGLAVSCAAGSWADVEDLGPVSGSVPAVFPDIGCRIRRAAVQLLTTGGGSQDIIFDTEDVDTHGFFTPSSTVVTVPAGQAGMYLIGGQVAAAANTGTTCYADLKIGGVIYQRCPGIANASPPFPMFMVNLAVGNTIGLAVFHSAGVSVNFTANMIVQKIGLL